MGETLREHAGDRIRQLRMPTAAWEDWRFVDFSGIDRARHDHQVTPNLRAGALPVINGDATRIGDEPDERILAMELERLRLETELPACWSWSGSVRHLMVTGEQSLMIDHHALQAHSGWRLIIEVQRSARLNLTVIHHTAPLTCTSIGVVLFLAQGAQVTIDEICPGKTGQCFIHLDANLERDSRLRFTSVGHGGELFRNRITGTLLGAGAEMDVAALDQVDDWDQAHRRIHVRHAVGHTQSRQLFKTVLAHRGAKTSFDGLIQIDVGADGSDAEQLSKNLILVGGARADAKPQLDVHADEVKAAHGATVGQLDPDEVLYLRMRGIPAVDATGLLKHGFSGEVLERLNPQSLALFAETP